MHTLYPPSAIVLTLSYSALSGLTLWSFPHIIELVNCLFQFMRMGWVQVRLWVTKECRKLIHFPPQSSWEIKLYYMGELYYRHSMFTMWEILIMGHLFCVFFFWAKKYSHGPHLESLKKLVWCFEDFSDNNFILKHHWSSKIFTFLCNRNLIYRLMVRHRTDRG